MDTHLRALSRIGLSNEYQHDKVFKNVCILVLWKKVASALEGLRCLSHKCLINLCHGISVVYDHRVQLVRTVTGGHCGQLAVSF